MKLGHKLFLSYLFVIAAGLVVLAVLSTFITPLAFNRHMQQLEAGETQSTDTGNAGAGSPGGGMRGGGMMAGRLAGIQESFRRVLNQVLLLSGLAAVLAAALASWAISQLVVRPVRDLAAASHRIAAGHYDERLVFYDADDELGELTRSFNQMAAALNETEKMRQQLIADVSHELKTPLASIKGYLEGMQDGVIEASPETFDLIQRETTRLQRLVHDLQELSRAEASQLEMAIRPCDAVTLVGSAVEWLRPQFEDKGVTLTTRLPSRPLQVLADFDRIRQVLTNLLGNALQYTPAGGEVIASLAAEDGQAHFTVRDSGVGLSAGDLERIFQRFYRVDKSRARASGGSGIGLTIARHIVEAHGGRIWAESAGPGQGSTFHFTIPLAG